MFWNHFRILEMKNIWMKIEKIEEIPSSTVIPFRTGVCLSLSLLESYILLFHTFPLLTCLCFPFNNPSMSLRIS